MTDSTEPGLTALRAVFPQLEETDPHYLHSLCRIPYPLRRIQHVSFITKTYEHALEKLTAQLRATLE